MTNPSLQIGDGNWAYKEDNLLGYAISPVNNKFLPREMTFTRASDGTRVNEDGLIENVPWNFFTYSEDLSNAAWTKLNSTITTNATTAPNGTTTADKVVEDTSVNVLHRCGQGSISVINGQQYTFSFYAKAAERFIFELQRINTSGTVFNSISETLVNLSTATISEGSNVDASSITSVGNGWYRITITLTAIATGSGGLNIGLCDENGNYFYTGNGVSGAYIWGGQVNQGSTAKPYFPTTNRQDVPRIDYSSGTGALLLEPQRTNLALYSEQFDNAAWGKTRLNTTGTPAWVNVAVSPNGTTTAEKLMPTTDNNSHFISFTATKTASAYSQSVYAKAGEYSVLQINNQDDSSFANFNLSTGVVGTVSGYTASITPVGNGWYRCEATKTYIANTSDIRFAIVTSPTSIRLENFAGNGSDGIYIWGAQIEAGSYPTSYIPTTSSSVTRLADACYRTGISEYIGQTEGTLFIEFVYVPFALDMRVGISDGTSANYNNFRITSGGTLYVLGANSSVLQYEINAGALTDGETYKAALKYNTNDIEVFVNGISKGTDTSASPAACDRFGFDNRAIGQNPLFSNIKQSILFPTALTEAECIALTTL